jgi:polysaccharide deacetylase 2 family uncharacterized protein YibQ
VRKYKYIDTCLLVLRQHEPGRAVGYGLLLSTGSAANESHLHGETMYYRIQYSSVILPMPLSPKEYARNSRGRAFNRERRDDQKKN